MLLPQRPPFLDLAHKVCNCKLHILLQVDFRLFEKIPRAGGDHSRLEAVCFYEERPAEVRLMRSMARLLKVASEPPVELPSVPISRRLPLPTVPLSGSWTSCASSRHTCTHASRTHLTIVNNR